MSANHNKQIAPDVLAILRECSVEGTVLRLPDRQLDRKLYEQTAKVIELAGGKWNRSARGFTFQGDPDKAIAKITGAVQSGTITDDKTRRQAFYTPPEVAALLAAHAALGGLTILEPSAGDGAIAEAAMDAGAREVECVEIEPECRAILTAKGFPVRIADFLTLTPEPRFPVILMNPPFTRGQYILHCLRAKYWLANGGTLLAIVPDNACKVLAEVGFIEADKIPAGAFKQSGTMVATRIVRYDKPFPVRARRR